MCLGGTPNRPKTPRTKVLSQLPCAQRLRQCLALGACSMGVRRSFLKPAMEAHSGSRGGPRWGRSHKPGCPDVASHYETSQSKHQVGLQVVLCASHISPLLGLARATFAIQKPQPYPRDLLHISRLSTGPGTPQGSTPEPQQTARLTRSRAMGFSKARKSLRKCQWETQKPKQSQDGK